MATIDPLALYRALIYRPLRWCLNARLRDHLHTCLFMDLQFLPTSRTSLPAHPCVHAMRYHYPEVRPVVRIPWGWSSGV
jgi:hypothetical protein